MLSNLEQAPWAVIEADGLRGSGVVHLGSKENAVDDGWFRGYLRVTKDTIINSTPRFGGRAHFAARGNSRRVEQRLESL